MEVRAARYYYHMPVGGEVYPARFADHNRVVGVLGALATGAQTWFGPSPIYAHGIQILPVTPATEDLLKPPSFIAEDLAFLDQVLAGDAAVDDSWSSLVVCERAVLDPERAWKEMMALQTVDGGASKAALLYWIATRPAADAETKALLAKAEAGG
jgi:endoglucanase Acf2